jgi:DNA-binding NarL/FixJ family response regulator
MSESTEATEGTESAAEARGPIRVVIVDDHAIWRGGTRTMLEDTEFEVVGEASSGKEALQVAEALDPDMVLLDIRMAGGDGLDALLALKQRQPRATVIMVTTYDNPTYMARAVAGGASGYLLKGMDQDEFLESLRRVAEGESLLTRDGLTRALRGVSEAGTASGELIEPLTEREIEVLRLVATGLNNRDIARILFIAEGTVKTHVEHIIRKLGVSDRVQAAVWAARNQMLEAEGSA